MATFTNRIIRAAKLDVHLYEEVEADPGTMGQAMGVVVLSSVAAGLAVAGRTGLVGLFVGIIGALISWFVWAYLTYFIGTKILPEPQTRANHGELLRTFGFSSAPGLIQVLGIIPAVGILVMPVASIWMLIAMVIAVRQALDYSGTLRAVGVCIIGWIFLIIIRAVLLSLIR